MGFIDKQGLFSDAQALTVTAASTNVVNLGGDRNIGIGEPMAVQITIDVALTWADEDETYTFTVQTDTVENFASPTTIATHAHSGVALAAGNKIVLGIPADTSCQQYLRVYYTLAGTTPTGTVTAVLIPQNMIQNYVSYADNITIS